jgi:hypothetical protein
MQSRNMPRALVAAAAVLAAAALVAAPAGAAGKAQLKFFSHVTSQSLTDASGNPLSGREPVAGDRIVVTDVNYAGNHKHHAKRYTSTDHLACTFTGADSGVCDGQFNIGPSMLLTENATISFKDPRLTFPITGGTGRYRGAKGTIVSTSVGGSDDSDVVISLR